MRILRFVGRWARDIVLFLVLLVLLLVCWLFGIEWL
jgi:hypothetical protein